MGNQLRALEAGLAVARVLGRMLVVPDYIADNGEGQLPTVISSVCVAASFRSIQSTSTSSC